MNQLRLAGGTGIALLAMLVLVSSALAAGPRPGALELPGKRTATSNTFLNPDGTFSTIVATSPVNYRTATGAWEPIDTALVPTSEPGYAVQSSAGPFRAFFKNNAGDGFVRFDVGGAPYTLGLQGAAAHGSHIHGSSISYTGALPGTDLGYQVLGTGIKETMTLADANGPSTFRFVLDGAGSLTATPRADGSVAFSGAGASQPTFVLSSPWAADTIGGQVVHAGETHPQVAVHQLGNGRYDVSVSVDKSWLASSARHFPVVVDPTITITAAQDAEFETSCTYQPCQTRDDDPMSIGGDDVSTYAVGVQFNLTAVPNGASVSDAELGLHFNGQCGWTNQYGFDCPPSSNTIDVHRMTAPWSEGSVTPQTAPGDIRYDAGVLSSAMIAAGAPAGWLNWNVTGTTQSWLAGTQPNDGLLLKHNPDARDSGAPTFESSEDWDSTLFPQLVITYSGGTTPPPPNYGQAIVADAPVGYWKLADLGTTTAADSSGLNHPGDYSGSFTLGQPGLLAHPSDTAVTFHNTSFDGRMTTQYLYGYAGSAVTAETWVSYTGATGVDQLVSRGYASNGGWSLGLTRTSGIQQAQFTVVAKGGVKYTATANVTPGRLYLAGSYDGSTVRLYVNGTLAATRTLNAAALSPTANTMLAGVLADDVTLDETAIYDHALTGSQIASHYTTGAP